MSMITSILRAETILSIYISFNFTEFPKANTVKNILFTVFFQDSNQGVPQTQALKRINHTNRNAW